MIFTKKALLGSLSFATVLIVGNWSVLIANASPDPVFNTILQDIQSKLPNGMVMRLPSVLKGYGYQGSRIALYPIRVIANKDSLAITLHAIPDCLAYSCYYGSLKVTANDSRESNWIFIEPISRQNAPRRNKKCGILSREAITLNGSIKAVSVVKDYCGADTGKRSYIAWKQDGYTFVVNAGSSTSNGIEIANSMASEPPIYNLNTARKDSPPISTSSIPKSFRHGCGTGCSVDVTFTSPVRKIQTADNRIIRFASIRTDFRGAGRGGESGSSNSYIFAECSANKLAGGTSATPPSASDKWTKLSGDRSDYTTVSGFKGGYFDALCIGKVRSYYNYSSTIPSVPPSSTPIKPTDTTARYPTDAEMAQLNQKYERDILPRMKTSREFGRNAEGERSPSLDSFANQWAKINPDLSPFLGDWQRQVANLMIYPSKTSKNACVVSTRPAPRSSSRNSSTNNLDAQFAIASLSNGQLRIKTSGWFNNFLSSGAILVRRGNVLTIANIGVNGLYIDPYSAYSRSLRPPESLPLVNTEENRKVVQQFYDAGCTASFPTR
jgi:hypothetical protein